MGNDQAATAPIPRRVTTRTRLTMARQRQATTIEAADIYAGAVRLDPQESPVTKALEVRL